MTPRDDAALAEAPPREAMPRSPFGVEIEWDLSRPLSPEDAARLVRLVDEHGVLIARNQRLTMDQQRQVLGLLGRIEEYDLQYVDLDDNILNRDEMGFHADMAFAHTPYKYLSLHAVDVVAGESSTNFASGALAYRRLSAEQRKRLAALTTTQVVGTRTHRGIGYDAPPDGPRAIHPAVIYHHRTSQPILFVNHMQSCRFNELPREESDALLEELFAILYSPDAILVHDWTPGDLVIWDNHAVQHGRPSLEKVTARHLQRMSVSDVPGVEMLPNYLTGLPASLGSPG
jgi:taurine dioxygenase